MDRIDESKYQELEHSRDMWRMIAIMSLLALLQLGITNYIARNSIKEEVASYRAYYAEVAKH